MATSGSFNTTAYEGRYLTFAWTRTSYNVDNNTSTISWTIKGGGDASHDWYMTGPVELILNGQKSTFSKRIAVYSGTTYESGTVVIPHNSDGTKSFSVSLRAAIYSSSYNKSGSSTFAINAIPRVTTPTFSPTSVYMGSNVTISLNRASANFTHTLKYEFQGLTGTIGTGIGTGTTWTVPSSFIDELPKASSGTVRITCDTYNGSTKIGSKTVSLTVLVPTSVMPTISDITITEASSDVINKGFTVFVRNQSKLHISVSAVGSHSSTIESYNINVGGVKYSGNNITTDFIKTYNDVVVTAVVTDSRGRSATLSRTISVHYYITPTISKFTVKRVNASKEESAEGKYLQATYYFRVRDVNFQNKPFTYKIQYKKKGSSENYQTAFTNTVDSRTASDYIVSRVFTSDTNIISPDYAYDVKLVVSDKFYTVEKEADLPTGFTVVDYNFSGKGIAFGKVSEKDAFEVAMPAEFNKGFIYKSSAIPAKADLNSYMDPGHFYGVNGESGVDSNRVYNCPYYYQNTYFELEVSQFGSDYFTQVCTVYTPNLVKRYRRYYKGSVTGWSSWFNESPFIGASATFTCKNSITIGSGNFGKNVWVNFNQKFVGDAFNIFENIATDPHGPTVFKDIETVKVSASILCDTNFVVGDKIEVRIAHYDTSYTPSQINYKATSIYNCRGAGFTYTTTPIIFDVQRLDQIHVLVRVTSSSTESKTISNSTESTFLTVEAVK